MAKKQRVKLTPKEIAKMLNDKGMNVSLATLVKQKNDWKNK